MQLIADAAVVTRDESAYIQCCSLLMQLAQSMMPAYVVNTFVALFWLHALVPSSHASCATWGVICSQMIVSICTNILKLCLHLHAMQDSEQAAHWHLPVTSCNIYMSDVP